MVMLNLVAFLIICIALGLAGRALVLLYLIICIGWTFANSAMNIMYLIYAACNVTILNDQFGMNTTHKIYWIRYVFDVF